VRPGSRAAWQQPPREPRRHTLKLGEEGLPYPCAEYPNPTRQPLEPSGIRLFDVREVTRDDVHRPSTIGQVTRHLLPAQATDRRVRRETVADQDNPGGPRRRRFLRREKQGISKQ